MSTPELDNRLRLIQNWKRRETLRVLRHTTNGKATVDDIVGRLGGNASSDDFDQPVNQNSLAIELIHNHLPRLADHGVIEYNRESGTVSYRPDAKLETVLDALPEKVSAGRGE